MEISEVKAFLDANKDKPEVISAIAGYVSPETYFKMNQEAGKYFDSKVSKSIETYRNETMPKLLDESLKKEMEKMNPTITPEMKRIAELEKRLAEKDAAEKRSMMQTLAMKLATEKGLPLDLVDHFLGDDEKMTTDNIEKLGASLAKYQEGIKTSLVKTNAMSVPASDGKTIGELGPNPTKEQAKEYFMRQIKENK